MIRRGAPPKQKPKFYYNKKLREIRLTYNASQEIFAQVINISKKTLQSWEYEKRELCRMKYEWITEKLKSLKYL